MNCAQLEMEKLLRDEGNKTIVSKRTLIPSAKLRFHLWTFQHERMIKEPHKELPRCIPSPQVVLSKTRIAPVAMSIVRTLTIWSGSVLKGLAFGPSPIPLLGSCPSTEFKEWLKENLTTDCTFRGLERGSVFPTFVMNFGKIEIIVSLRTRILPLLSY